MNSMAIKRARGLDYIGPRKALLVLTIHQDQVMSQQPHLPKHVQNWRTNKLQPELHRRQAALFCFGRKCMEATDKWALAAWPDQNSEIDYVFRQTKPDGEVRFEFVQLKELVPDEIDPEQSLQDLLDKLPKKYPSAGGLTIAIHLHRNTTTKVSDLKKPHLPGGSLWLFGLGGKPPHNALLFGDWLKTPSIVYFTHPTFFSGESLTQWKGALDDED
jgi:hypothetical protein